MFPSISPKQSFPALESEVLAYWKANNTFQKSIDSRPADNPYRFYDGPPFITGTPHYGSLLSSVVKDVVGRYWTMRGKRVDRVWGWDCHGLPIEEKVMKKLNLNSNKEIEERGVKEFIDGCYEYTQSTSAEWNWYIDKIGRWVDMDHAYRTMDQDYMESVMWVFSELWKKWLIYEGKRVSLYSWKLGTPISNFEVAMDDTYQEVNDPAITVKFELEKNDKFPEGTKVLAWTTTPWTIPANMALAVRNDIDYVLVHYQQQIVHEIKNRDANNFPGWAIPLSESINYNGEDFIVAKNRIDTIFNRKQDTYTIIREFKGSELVGLGYVPPFPEYYYKKVDTNTHTNTMEWDNVSETKNKSDVFLSSVSVSGSKNHKIYHADFITDTDGTGIGHEAPEFGDVDFQLAKREGIFISEAMDEAGKYTSQIFDYEGTHYLDLDNPEKWANKINIERMKANNTLFKLEGITHRVPFCPRSGTPLVQKAQASWFIDIQSQKEKLLKANEQINWFPEHLKFGRFAKGIESAPDWCISRTRYWGAPMPVWQNQDGSERVVVSSREEIFEMNKPYGQLTKVIFVRHGESVKNIEGIIDGTDKPRFPLTENGRKKALETSEKLASEKISAIYSSSFARSQETAEIINKKHNLNIKFDDRLREVFLGDMDGKKVEDIKEHYWKEHDQYVSDWNHKIWWWESANDILERMKSFVQEIWEKHPWETVLIVSHADQIALIKEYLTDEKAFANNIDLPKVGEPISIYYDRSSQKQLNLHKPYIDSVFLAPKNARKVKKVLGVHGWTSKWLQKWYEWKWLPLQDLLKEHWIQFDVPDFDKNQETSYAKWSETLETLDINSYDTIMATSFGCPVIIQYLCEKQIKIPRLILVAPSGLKWNEYLEKVIPEMTEDIMKLKWLVDEIIITHSRDDDSSSAKFEYGKSLAEKLSCTFVPIDGVWHNFWGWSINLLSGLIQYGSPLIRIPEVLDVWMDSGSMPYAQMHYPFAGFEDITIKKAETIDEKEICFAFFQKMWKEEFDKDFLTAKQGFETIKNRFFECTVFYIGDLNYLESVIEIGKQIIEDEFIPIGASILWRIGTLNEMRWKWNGTKLIKRALSDLTKKWEKEIYIHAEIKNIEFYKSFWFKKIQDVPTPVWNTASIAMKKTLTRFDQLQSLVFPADFIAEYVGQVRAWFYVMHVLGVLLMSKDDTNTHTNTIEIDPVSETKNNSTVSVSSVTVTPAFTNVITTGVINGNDGRKMSKSFGNYPDPRITIEKYGADPIRFYMLNSPLLSGGDMDFREEGIIETIKGVMLPIWNTYSFFTTYANIDGWKKDDTEVWFSRHAESTSNAATTMSDGTDNPGLTEKGKQQSKNASKILKDEGKSFDIIIHTSMLRAHDTAHIIGDEIWFTGEYIMDDSFIEQAAGEYARMTHDTMRTTYAKANNLDPSVVTDSQIRTMYKNNSLENIEKFEKRILAGYENILEKYSGKKILIVAHAGTSRPILNHYFGKWLEWAHYETTIGNAEPYRLMTTPLVNPLDRWILSKLQVLIGQVHDAMDSYDISRACRAIVDYMDEMTNWYVRLSRRRFWGSEMTSDKASAYETLYTVLVELSKLLAPYMPFLSEAIYKGLTGTNPLEIGEDLSVSDSPPKIGGVGGGVHSTRGTPHLTSPILGEEWNSVHLQYITRPSRHLIDNELNRDMEICEHIVSLGLALRSQKNIRVRQPLGFVTITQELSEYYQEIIRDELNVKEVRFEEPERLAKKICKPDARKIWPKYGKDVQIIIQQAKAGNFVEWEDGRISLTLNPSPKGEGSGTDSPSLKEKGLGDEVILEPGEYTLEYLPLEWVGDIIGGYGMVISLDTIITEELKLEGYARDLIRTIQDMRKEANYNVTDRVDIAITGWVSTLIMADWKSYIERETLSKVVDTIDVPDIEKKIIDDEIGEITLQIKR